MTSKLSIARVMAGAGLAMTLAACSDSATLIKGPTPVADLFARYVALGNSLTAGYQSSGINDSTQRESYAALLATAMNTRYAYASLAMPGCEPPIVNFQTQARVGNAAAGSCSFRSTGSITSYLNNVAVPGANSIDPTSATGSTANPLTTFILGGKTQVQRAAETEPTFVSAWIGNNDVLFPALSGLLTATGTLSPGIPSQEAFAANYDAMLAALDDIKTIKGGVLIGVVQVAAGPVLFPAAALFNPAFKAGFDAFAGGTVTILPTCSPVTTALISFRIVAEMRSGTHPRVIGCAKNSVPGTLIGDIFVLDATEQATLAAAVDGYNAHIAAAATSRQWAYYDPNPLLFSLKQQGCVGTVPNLASPTQPFGACISLTGDPTRLGHVAIANGLVQAINQKFSTTLPAVQ